MNLRQARKKRERDEKEQRAEANRVRFGTSKRAKVEAADGNERSRNELDGHLRER